MRKPCPVYTKCICFCPWHNKRRVWHLARWLQQASPSATGGLGMNVSSAAHQWRLTEQLAASNQVPDGDVEVRIAAAPVGDLSERVSCEDVLQEVGLAHRLFSLQLTSLTRKCSVCSHLRLWIKQTDSVFVDGYQKGFWVIWICRLLRIGWWMLTVSDNCCRQLISCSTSLTTF